MRPGALPTALQVLGGIPAGAGSAYLVEHGYLPMVLVGVALAAVAGWISGRARNPLAAGSTLAAYEGLAAVFGLPALLNTDPAVHYHGNPGAWLLTVAVMGLATVAAGFTLGRLAAGARPGSAAAPRSQN